MTSLGIKDFLCSMGDADSVVPILDVRSPSEYSTGHIPGAISFPLFTDDERAEVGTLYKQVGPEAAKKRGTALAEPKIPNFLSTAKKLGTTLAIHCWRGGLRSQAMANLLQQNGHEITLLEGGYKAYRQALMSFFSAPLNLRVLTGHTGSMKTEVLLELRKQGHQVIDLEGAANHQGSSFGNAQTTGQPQTEHFQNLVYEQARMFDSSKAVWIEDESYRIGHCIMIQPLYNQMQRSPHLQIIVDMERRLDHLVKNYGEVDKEKLITATKGIRNRLGDLVCTQTIRHIKEGDMRSAARLALSYYDKQYAKSLAKKGEQIYWVKIFKEESCVEMAEMIDRRVLESKTH